MVGIQPARYWNSPVVFGGAFQKETLVHKNYVASDFALVFFGNVFCLLKEVVHKTDCIAWCKKFRCKTGKHVEGGGYAVYAVLLKVKDGLANFYRAGIELPVPPLFFHEGKVLAVKEHFVKAKAKADD